MYTNQKNNKQMNILHLCNNKSEIKIVDALLGRHFNIIHASHYDESVKMIGKYSIDIVINNNPLNLTDQVSLLKSIRFKKYEHIKIFALTQNNIHKHDLIKKGFDDVFTKPIIKEDIYEAIDVNCYQ